jgi:mRNA-degrading endonuclease RelE of RelBE toxin-antitoxin system
MFTIEFAQSVIDDLAELRASDRQRILNRIDEQLLHQPHQETRNKKPIDRLGAAVGAYAAGVGVANRTVPSVL